MKTLGERIRKYRTDKGMTQGSLAAGICTTSAIYQYEKNIHRPSAEILIKLAERLSIPLHELTRETTQELDLKAQLLIVKKYIETNEFHHAINLVENLEQRDDLLEYQRRELCMDKAECFMRTGKASQALELLSVLQQRLELEKESDDDLLSNLYNKIGNAYFFLADVVNAYTHYKRAYVVSKRLPKSNHVSAMIQYNLGKIQNWRGEHEAAIQHFINAEQYFAEVSDQKKLAQTLFDQGIAYKDMKLIEKAEECLRKSLSLFEAENIFQMARRVKQEYVTSVLSLTNPYEAEKQLVLIAKEFEGIGEGIQVDYTYALLAKLCLDQKNLLRAGEYLRSASIDLERKDPRIAFLLRIWAQYHYNTGNFEKAIRYSKWSADMFLSIGLEQEGVVSLQVSLDCYKQEGKYDKALEISEHMLLIVREYKRSG